MNRLARLATLVVSAGLVLVGGCATKTSGVANPVSGFQGGGPSASSSPSSSSGGGTAVEFADEVCVAMLKFVEPALDMQSFQPDVSSPSAAVGSITTALTNLSTALESSLAALSDIDSTVVDGGDVIVSTFTSAFSQLKQRIDKSTDKLSSINPNDPQQVTAALQEVGTDLESVSDIGNTFDSLGDTSPELDRAAREAPSCQKIEELGTGAGSAPPTR